MRGRTQGGLVHKLKKTISSVKESMDQNGRTAKKKSENLINRRNELMRQSGKGS